MRILFLGTALATFLWAASAELRKAEELYQQTRYREALQVAQPLLDQNADALLLAGRAAYRMGDYRKATEYLEKLIQRDPSSSAGYHWLGRAFGRRAETSFPLSAPHYASKARQSFEKAVELNPANGEALNDLFEYYLQAPGFLGGGLDKAQALLPKIRAVDAAEHEFAMAKLQEARKDFQSAERHLRRAAELAPKSVGRVLDVARFLARHGRFSESVTWLGRAAKIAPKHPQVLFQTAQTYIEAKQNLPVARSLLQEYLDVPPTPDLPPREDAEKLLKASPMNWREVLRSSLQALQANRVRTLLTALGLVIGNASVILVVTISLTSRDYVLEQIRGIGSNLIIAYYEAGNRTGTQVEADFVKIADVAAVRNAFPGRISAATGVMTVYDQMVIQGKVRDVKIIGSDEQYAPVRNLVNVAGRFMQSDDVALRNRVAMLTEKLAVKLYGSQSNAIGQVVKIQGLQFTIIGTFREKTDSFGLSELSTETILVPITVLKYLTSEERIDPMYVQARDPGDVVPLTRQVQAMLESRHRTGAKYYVDNLTGILAAAENIALILTVVLILVSAITLLISGIGIMNIMLVTVTERTREIGIRLAVGATRRAVLTQFLAEAVLISVGGGLLGILVGVAIPWSAGYFGGIDIPISPISVAVAFSTSFLVGLVFGLLPANRASRLNPTEALRYE